MAAKQKLNLQMWRAAKKGDVETVRACLVSGADPDYVNPDEEEHEYRYAALHLCGLRGHHEVAAVLIKHKADVNVRDSGQRTPLHLCALNDKPQVAQLLLDHGAAIELTNYLNNRPLHWAAGCSSAVTSLLVDKGADVNVAGWGQQTPLHYSARWGNAAAARVILGCGRFTALLAKDEDGDTALDVAREKGKEEVVRLLEEAASGDGASAAPPTASTSAPTNVQKAATKSQAPQARPTYRQEDHDRQRLDQGLAMTNKASGAAKQGDTRPATAVTNLTQQLQQMQEQLARLQASQQSSSSRAERDLKSELNRVKQELSKRDAELDDKEKRLQAIESKLEHTTLPPGKLYSQLEPYSLTEGRYGRVVVFANANYRDLPPRVGADADVRDLRATFGGLGYKVVVVDDSTAEDMKAELDDIAEGSQAARFSTCFFIFLAHGGARGVLGVDSQPLCDGDIYTAVGRSSNLRGKPKVVLIDACQGNEQQGSTNPWHDSAEPEADLSSQEYSRPLDPIGLDLMLVKSTIPRHVSKTHESKGSIFIRELCRVIRENAGSLHFEDMFKLVARQVVEAASVEGLKACPSLRHNGLTKPFFLRP